MADLAITASEVVPGANARLNHAIAAVALVAGKAIHLDPANANKAALSDANGGTDQLAKVDGITTNDAAAGQNVEYARPGDEITLGATGGAPVVGTPYVLSATPGGIAPVGDLASGWRTTIIGVGAAGNKLAKLLLSASDQAVP